MHWVVGGSLPHDLAADATPLGSPTVKQTIRPSFHAAAHDRPDDRSPRSGDLALRGRGGRPFEPIVKQPRAGLDEPAGVVGKMLAVFGEPLQILR
jgi:hypothetical protein